MAHPTATLEDGPGSDALMMSVGRADVFAATFAEHQKNVEKYLGGK